jgi:hypothetical protein
MEKEPNVPSLETAYSQISGEKPNINEVLGEVLYSVPVKNGFHPEAKKDFSKLVEENVDLLATVYPDPKERTYSRLMSSVGDSFTLFAKEPQDPNNTQEVEFNTLLAVKFQHLAFEARKAPTNQKIEAAQKLIQLSPLLDNLTENAPSGLLTWVIDEDSVIDLAKKFLKFHGVPFEEDEEDIEEISEEDKGTIESIYNEFNTKKDGTSWPMEDMLNHLKEPFKGNLAVELAIEATVIRFIQEYDDKFAPEHRSLGHFMGELGPKFYKNKQFYLSAEASWLGFTNSEDDSIFSIVYAGNTLDAINKVWEQSQDKSEEEQAFDKEWLKNRIGYLLPTITAIDAVKNDLPPTIEPNERNFQLIGTANHRRNVAEKLLHLDEEVADNSGENKERSLEDRRNQSKRIYQEFNFLINGQQYSYDNLIQNIPFYEQYTQEKKDFIENIVVDHILNYSKNSKDLNFGDFMGTLGVRLRTMNPLAEMHPVEVAHMAIAFFINGFNNTELGTLANTIYMGNAMESIAYMLKSSLSDSEDVKTYVKETLNNLQPYILKAATNIEEVVKQYPGKISPTEENTKSINIAVERRNEAVTLLKGQGIIFE